MMNASCSTTTFVYTVPFIAPHLVHLIVDLVLTDASLGIVPIGPEVRAENTITRNRNNCASVSSSSSRLPTRHLSIALAYISSNLSLARRRLAVGRSYLATSHSHSVEKGPR